MKVEGKQRGQLESWQLCNKIVKPINVLKLNYTNENNMQPTQGISPVGAFGDKVEIIGEAPTHPTSFTHIVQPSVKDLHKIFIHTKHVNNPYILGGQWEFTLKSPPFHLQLVYKNMFTFTLAN